LLGGEMESGQAPNNENLIGTMIEDICYNNAAAYLGLPAIEAKTRSGKVPAVRF
jgi:hypothetical protein